MIKKLDHQLMGRSKGTWLNTYYHFSFGNYYKEDNMHYGMLRVVNDDTIQPNSGFDMHSHRNMEILTYVVQGELSHMDSHGNKSHLRRGCVQIMSAGTGIEHSEKNETDSLLRLIQIWIYPNLLDLAPSYECVQIPWHDRYNRWLLFASGEMGKAPIYIHQDMNVYAAELSDAIELAIDVKPLRQIYLVVLEGRVRINDIMFDAHDAAEINECTYVKAASWAHLLMFEMPIV